MHNMISGDNSGQLIELLEKALLPNLLMFLSVVLMQDGASTKRLRRGLHNNKYSHLLWL